jgi:Uma2 family endonuclease
MGSPVRARAHAEPDALIQYWLGHFVSSTPNVAHATNPTVIFGPDDVFQPDGVLCVWREHGGKTFLNESDYLEGSPELIVEIAASSVSLDMHRKKNVYRRCGVREYLVWCTEEAQLNWWTLADDDYRPLIAGDDGILRSLVFPGLWLDVNALLAEDRARLASVLESGLKSRSEKP